MRSLIVLSLASLLSFSAYATTKAVSDTSAPSYEVSVLKDGQPLMTQNVIFQDNRTMTIELTRESACIKSINTSGHTTVITPSTIKTGLTFTLKPDIDRHLVQAKLESATVVDHVVAFSGKCVPVIKENIYREIAIGPHTTFTENIGKLSGHDYTLTIKRND